VVPDGAAEELAAWRRAFPAFAVANTEARRLARIYIENIRYERVNECRGLTWARYRV